MILAPEELARLGMMLATAYERAIKNPLLLFRCLEIQTAIEEFGLGWQEIGERMELLPLEKL